MKTPLLLGALALLAIAAALFLVSSGGNPESKKQAPRVQPHEIADAPPPAIAKAPEVAAQPPASQPASQPALAEDAKVFKATDHRVTKEMKYFIRHPDGRVEEKTGMMTATPVIAKYPIVQRNKGVAPTVKPTAEAPPTPIEAPPASQPSSDPTDH